MYACPELFVDNANKLATACTLQPKMSHVGRKYGGSRLYVISEAIINKSRVIPITGHIYEAGAWENVHRYWHITSAVSNTHCDESVHSSESNLNLFSRSPSLSWSFSLICILTHSYFYKIH